LKEMLHYLSNYDKSLHFINLLITFFFIVKIVLE